jgi:hypothetical protein
LFAQEFTVKTVREIRTETQDSKDFFIAIAGGARFVSNGIEFFSFMRPSTQFRSTVDRCTECHGEIGKSSQDYHML